MALNDDAPSRPVGFCPIHGLFIDVHSAGAIAPCPQCGRDSRVLKERDRDVLIAAHGVIDTSATIEAVFNMRDLLERVQRGEIANESAITQARAIDPQFGRVVTKTFKVDPWAVPALISMLSLYFRIKDDYSGRVQVNNLIRVLDRQKEPFEKLREALGVGRAMTDTTAGASSRAAPSAPASPDHIREGHA